MQLVGLVGEYARLIYLGVAMIRVYPIFAVLIFLAIGCGKQQGADDDVRIRSTIIAYEAKLRGASGVREELTKNILEVLKQASPASLSKPQLCAAALWGAENVPRVEFWWVEAHPTADGLIFRWKGNEVGKYLPIPKGILDESMQDNESTRFICFASGIPLKTYIDSGLGLPNEKIEVALARNGKAISAFIACRNYLSTGREASTQPLTK